MNSFPYSYKLLLTLLFAANSFSFSENVECDSILESEELENHPKIKIELIGIETGVNVFDHSNSCTEISMYSPIQFTTKKTIFYNKTTQNLQTGRNLKFRLTCVAPYFTKWTFNSNSDDEKSQWEKDISLMNYEIKQLPRDSEDIEDSFLMSDEHTLIGMKNSNTSLSYNLTELIIVSFGPKFKYTFIDCIKRSDVLIKSRLQIFRRFDDILQSVDTNDKTLENLSIIPCKVFDPRVRPSLQKQSPKSSQKKNNWQNVSHLKFDWNSGFNLTKEKEFANNTNFRCLLNEKPYVKFLFQQSIHDQKTKLHSLRPVLFENAFNEPITKESFFCTRSNSTEIMPNSENEYFEAITIEFCLSPDYCFPTIERSQALQFQGRVSCSVDSIPGSNYDYFFTGLSGRVYLLSQEPSPYLNEIVALKITEESDFLNITCSAVLFLTFPTIRISLIYSNGSSDFITDNMNLPFNEILPNFKVHEKTKTFAIHTANATEIKKFGCHVPWYNSTQWIHVWQTASISQMRKDNRSIDTRSGRNFNENKIVYAEPSNSIVTTVIVSCVSIAAILLIVFVSYFISNYYTVDCTFYLSLRRGQSTPDQEMKQIKPLKMKINIPSRLKISAEALTVDEKLIGEGEFCRIFHGYLQRAVAIRTPIHVKQNKVADDPIQTQAILNDLKIRIILGDQDQNILSILGAHIDLNRGIVNIVMEAENAKSVRNYLKINRNHQMILDMLPAKRTKLFLTWCKGFASGVKFLHEQKIIHGNLAAENILIFPNNSVKITGFSHSHKLDGNSLYFVKNRCWPGEWKTSGWKWMPIESLRYYEFSRQSDIWSFGVTIWEIFSLGTLPYYENSTGITCNELEFSMSFITQLEFGVRLPKPQFATKEIYDHMNKCWNCFGKDRPTISEISLFFQELLHAERLNSYV